MKKLLACFLFAASVSIPAQSLDGTLKQAASSPAALTQAMDSWLDATGFERLREALKDAKPLNALDWHARALLEERLLHDDEALEAWKKACGMKSGVTAEMRLGLVRALARARQFGEALKAVERLDDAALVEKDARDLLWLLLGISREQDFRSAAMARLRKLAAARPDDVETQNAFIRQERNINGSGAVRRRIHEGLENDSAPELRTMWQLYEIIDERDQGRREELVAKAMALLERLASDEETERTVVEHLRETFQNGRHDPKFKTTPQEIAAKFPNRAAIVRAMAEVLREGGETAEAVRLLGTLQGDSRAAGLLALWSAEDDREAELPQVVPAQVSEVKGALELPPEAAWKAELAALTDTGARLTKLLELRREFPAEAEVAMALIEVWSGQQRNAEGLHEALRMHFQSAGDEKQRQEWWERLGMNQSASWMVFNQAQAMPWLRDDPAFQAVWWARNGQERAADHISSERWREVFEALVRGMPRLASRVMLEQAGDAGLDAELAEKLAAGLMASREWRDAAVFLGLQRVRFPQDYRLAFLHGLALKGGGDAAGAEEVFLKMGSFTQEIRRRTRGQEGYHPRGMLILRPDAGLETWVSISQAVAASSQAEEMLARWMQEVAYARNMDHLVISPPSVKAAGAWGLAQLLQMVSERDAVARQALVERARASGLPLPELLEAGKIVRRVEYGTELRVDESWLAAHLELDWASEVLLRQVQMRMHLPGRTAEQKAADAATARQSSAALLAKKPSPALQAALLAWQLQPEAEVPTEVSAALEKVDAASANLLSQTLATLPHEVRRKAAGTMLPLVMALAGKEGVSAEQKAQLGTCALWLGAWKEAASLAADYQPMVRPDYQLPPAWAMMQASSPLQWPPQAAPWFYGFPPGGPPWLPENEKAAFLAAAPERRESTLRLAWLHTGGDAAGAEKEARAWFKAQPESQPAMLTAASLLTHEKKKEEALDLLHAWALRQKDADQRRLGLRLYLQAAFYPPGGGSLSMMNEAGRTPMPPPPPKHVKRLQQAGRELLPEVSHLAGGWMGSWHPVFQALDLSQANTTNNISRYQQGTWQGDEQARAEQNDSRRGRGEGQPVSSYTIKSLLEAGKKAQALELTLRQLRRDADQRFRGSIERQNASQIEEWRQVIANGAMSAELVKQVAPRKADDTHRLAQAVHVAEVCADWPQVIVWAETALKLDPDLPGMKLALASARQQLSGDPAVLVAVVRDLPPAEAKAAVLALLQQAQRSADFPHRLAVALAALDVLSKHPGVLEPETVMRDGVGIQTLSGSAYPPSEVLRQLFELLTQAVQDREGKRVAEGLHPGWSNYRQSSQGDSAKAATPALLDRRKTLHAQLCELSLKHPEWAETALRPLTGRHLVEGSPSLEELHAYARKAMTAAPQRSPSILQAWTGYGTPVDAALRYRLASLILPLLADAWKGRDNDAWSQSGLVELIGGQIPPPREHQQLLHALWEWPMDITDWKPVHTPEQLALNQQRRELMDQLWKTVQTIPALKREVFPAWAAYRLHFIESPAEVIEAAKGIEEARGGRSVLQSFLQLASQSFSNTHHILTAEVVEALLRQEPSQSTTPQPFPLGEVLDQTMRLLLVGRTDQSQPMPALTVTAEEAERLLGKGWRKRQMDVLARLEELFGDKAAPLPPELLFPKLQEALLADKDTSKIEASLLRLIEKNSNDYDRLLQNFIAAANGGRIYVEEGQAEGVWDLKRRLAWFEVALRLGKPLLESSLNGSSGRDEWLNDWIAALMKGCSAAEPPVPEVAGLIEYNTTTSEVTKAYLQNPLFAKRDELLLRGLEMEITSEQNWDRHAVQFTLLQLRRGKPGMDRMILFLDSLANTRPEQVLSRYLAKWEQFHYYPDEQLQLAAGRLLLEAFKRVPSIPTESSYGQAFEGWRRMVINNQSNYRQKGEIPLLPEQPWLCRQDGDYYDTTMSQPLARERLAVWKEVLEHMAGVPGLAFMAFPDLVRLHVGTNQARLFEIAHSFTDDEWFQAEHKLDDFFNEVEAHAATARRAAWGRFAILWEPEAVKRLKRSPEKTQYRRWPHKMLEFLHGKWEPDQGDRFLPPQPTAQERESLAEVTRLYAALLEGDPARTPEGFTLFARKQFTSGQPPETVLAVIRELLHKNPESASALLQKWFYETGTSEKPSTTESEWAAGIALSLASEWPLDSTSLAWCGSASRMLSRGIRLADERQGRLTDLLERFLEVLLRSSRSCGEVLAVYVVEASQDDARSQKLTQILLELASKDPKALSAVMHGWLPSPHAYREDWASRSLTARLAVQILQKWPQKAPPETLAWAHGLAHYLSTGSTTPDDMGFGMAGRGPNGEPLPFWFWPTPGATSEDRGMQREVLVFSSRMVAEDVSWRLPLALRLAAQPDLPDHIRVLGLRPFFEPEEKEKTFAALQELWGESPRLEEESHRMRNGMHHRPDAPVLPDRRAAAVLDAAACLQIAIREKWLSVTEAASLEETARTRLQSTIQQAQERTVEMKRSSFPFPLAGVLESQGREARKLLETWPALAVPAGDEALPPALLATAITQAMKQGQEVKTIVSRVMKAVAASPVPAAEALEKWAELQNHTLKLPEWLKLGPLAAELAEAWTKDMPPPDWLPVFLNAWQAANAPDDPSPPAAEKRAQHEKIAAGLVPGLRVVLRQYPACRYSGGYFAQAAIDYEGGSSEALARLAEEHLLAQPRGSISEIYDVPFHSGQAASIFDLPEQPDALLCLLDHLAVSEHEEWREKHYHPAIRAALSGQAADVFSRLEAVVVRPPAEFGKAARAFVPEPNRVTMSWFLRIAARRKIQLSPDTWASLTGLRKSIEDTNFGMQSSQACRLWIEYQAHLHPGGSTQHIRELFHHLLGEAFLSESQRRVFLTYRRDAYGNEWQGWPYQGGELNSKSPWRLLYETLEELTASPRHFRAFLETMRETRFGQAEGTLAWLMLAARREQQPPHPQWQALLEKNGLLDALPDDLWLLPQDGLVPVWEFAKALGITASPEAARWLEDRQQKKPSSGTALMLLAARRPFGAVLSVQDIAAALAPSLPELKKASTSRHAALSAALLTLQPALLDDPAVAKALHLLPALATTPERKALAAHWLGLKEVPAHGKDVGDYKKRLLPLALDVFRLIEAHDPQALPVIQHGLKLHAAHPWPQPLPEGITRQRWLHEQLAAVLIENAVRGPLNTTSAEFNVSRLAEDDMVRHRLEVLLRFLKASGEDFSIAASSQLVRRAREKQRGVTMAQRIELPLATWALEISLFGADYTDTDLACMPLLHLEKIAIDSPGLRTAAIHAASALSASLNQNNGRRAAMPPDSIDSAAIKVVNPLLDLLRSLGASAGRLQLMKAAATTSRLPLETLLEELRTAADKPAALAEWLPLYFHPPARGIPVLQGTTRRLQPAIAAADEELLAALGQFSPDDAPAQTARLLIAALPDASTAPPSQNRTARVNAVIQTFDLKRSAHLTAFNRLLADSGTLAALLRELLPLLRQHPDVLQWQKQPVIDHRQNLEAWHHRVSLTISLWAAAEALHGGNVAPWDTWTTQLAGLRSSGIPLTQTLGPGRSMILPSGVSFLHTTSVIVALTGFTDESSSQNDKAAILRLWDAFFRIMPGPPVVSFPVQTLPKVRSLAESTGNQAFLAKFSSLLPKPAPPGKGK